MARPTTLVWLVRPLQAALLAGLLATASEVVGDDSPTGIVTAYWAALSCGRFEEAAGHFHPKQLEALGETIRPTMEEALASNRPEARERALSFYVVDPLAGGRVLDVRKLFAALLRMIADGHSQPLCGSRLAEVEAHRNADGIVTVRAAIELASGERGERQEVTLQRFNGRLYLLVGGSQPLP